MLRCGRERFGRNWLWICVEMKNIATVMISEVKYCIATAGRSLEDFSKGNVSMVTNRLAVEMYRMVTYR